MIRFICLILAIFLTINIYQSSTSILHVSLNDDNYDDWSNDITSNFIDSASTSPLPIVIWHGMGDTCCEEDSMGRVKRAIESKLASTHVVSLMIGKNEKADFTNSYLLDVNEQISMACDTIKKDKKLAKGYNALGFSQGGQFFRAIAQRCPTPPINYLLTFGSQHQGVYGIPKCPGEGAIVCNFGRKLFNYGVYSDFVQSHLVQAQYWHDPIDEDTYVNKSTFIAEINNEKIIKKEYKDNLLKLNKFVMVQFMDDNVVDPQESSSFGYFLPGQAKVVVPMRMTRVYTENLIGLKELDESGRLEFIRVSGNHLRFNLSWFESAIIDKYLR